MEFTFIHDGYSGKAELRAVTRRIRGLHHYVFSRELSGNLELTTEDHLFLRHTILMGECDFASGYGDHMLQLRTGLLMFFVIDRVY